MSVRDLRLASLTAVVLLAACGLTGRLGAVTVSAAGRSAAAIHQGELRLGRTDPSTVIEPTLVLRLPGRRGLHRFLAQVNDPASARFGRYLDARTFGERFGLPAGRIAGLLREVRAAGFEVVGTFPQRTAIRLRGTAALVERVFSVRMQDRIDLDGQRFHQPVGPPIVPPALRGAVVGVTGLSDRPLVHPADPLTSTSAAVPAKGLSPNVAASAYGITPLWSSNIVGAGQTVAVVSFATFNDGDVAAFDQEFGIQGPAVEHVPVAGGTAKADLEVALDVEVIRGLAPQAQILDYEAPNGPVGFGEMIDHIAADGRAKIVSISWGVCDVPETASGDPSLDPNERLRDERSFEAAVAQGISIFVASGDYGAYTCQQQDVTDLRPTVSWPASSPSVIAVGGTLLSVNADGGYQEEAGWEDILSGIGTGGGLSPSDPRPAWQTGPGVDGPGSNGNRQVPDVAGPADPDSGFQIFASEKGQLYRYRVGGTSAATPFWAASTALVQAFVTGSKAGRLGFVAPMLYTLARDPAPFPAFHDVVRGGNRREVCAPGWDFATGIGSPDVFNLARDAAAYLGAH